MDFKKLLSNPFSRAEAPISKQLQKTISSIGDLFGGKGEESSPKIKKVKGILTLLGAVLWANGEVKEEEVHEIRKYLYGSFNEEEVEKLISVVKSKKEEE